MVLVKGRQIFSVLLVALLAGCVSDKNQNEGPNYNYAPILNQNKTPNFEVSPLEEELQNNPERVGCHGIGPVNLTQPPRSLNEIELIVPMGLMTGSHVTPVDHQYYYPPNWEYPTPEDKLVDVFAPADGVVSYINQMPDFFAQKNPNLGDYNFNIYHSCNFYTRWIHLYKLSPKLREVFKGKGPASVKAGEYIGAAGSFDFSVHDEERNLTGFISPNLYANEPWKIHTMNPYDYFTEPVRSLLMNKTLRWTAPIGGKIDYDVEGKLIGNWFVNNTNGYKGIKSPEYWVTHLSISPHPEDPTYTIISIGNFSGEAKQFGVKGGINPAEIGQKSGILKLELVDFEFLDDKGKIWDRKTYTHSLKVVDGQEIQGTILIEILSKNILKVQVFPKKTANEVSGFTDDAVLYTR